MHQQKSKFITAAPCATELSSNSLENSDIPKIGAIDNGCERVALISGITKIL